MRQIFIKLLGLGLAFAGQAGVSESLPIHKHLGSRVEQDHARAWNREHSTIMSVEAQTNWSVLKPFSEVEKTGYVAISGANNFELPALREAIAKNIPSGVTLVIYVADATEAADLKKLYGPLLPETQLKFLVTAAAASGDPIWARDSLPFPVYLKSSGAGRADSFGLVDSLYPQNFEPDADFAKALSLPMVQTKQYFRGGNLLNDLAGNCFLENVNEVADLQDPQTYFKQYFGCTSVTLLAQQGGIGDIDERIKFLSGNDVLTDNDLYASLLKAKGYAVHMIPSTGADNETYMNTLLVNGTMFVPQMGIPADQDALAAYRALGFTPVGVYTKLLATQGDGNIHCVTMNYPPGTFTASPLGADFVQFSSF